MGAEAARELFKEALADLQLALRDAEARPALYPAEFEVLDRNALFLRVADRETGPDGEEPGTYYFDLATTGGEIVLREDFLTAWDRTFAALRVDDRELRKTAFQLFILHELVHVPQNLDSPTHDGVREHQTILRTVDYHADAFAILLCFAIRRQRAPADARWSDLLASIIEANLLAIAVFEFHAIERAPIRPAGDPTVAPSRYPFDLMLASRLLRHLTWHYQYHRARSMPDRSSPDDFDIKREPVLSIEWLMRDSAGRGVTPDWPKQRPDAELWVADRNRHGLPVVYRHRGTKQDVKWGNLFRGIFEVDVNLSYQFFNELLSRARELVDLRRTQLGPAAEASATGGSLIFARSAKYAVDARGSVAVAIGDRARVEKTPSTDGT